MAPLVSQAQQRIARTGDALLRYADGKKASRADFRQKRAAIFIHGFTSDASYMDDLMYQFKQDGYEPFAFEYECFRGIDRAAKNLNELLTLLDEDNDISKERVVLVGHSMGGVVARAFIALENGARFVRKVIVLGTPNAGTLHDTRIPHLMAYWGEAVSELNPRGFSPRCRSALQLLGTDAPPSLVEQLMDPVGTSPHIGFYSISGGYSKLDFGKSYWKNFTINRYLQKWLTKPNDGLVPESSSDLSSTRFSACAPSCTHCNNYAEFEDVNHTYLVKNHSVLIRASQFAK